MPVLDWIGREAVVGHAHRVPLHLLTPDDAVSSDPAAENWIVEGDNLLALRALLPQFAGQVKCVYIDPPYNTGNEGWAYNDNMKAPEMQAWLAKTVGKEGEDLSRHDKWLCMMYPRLVLLREMLREDGSIWISLDDNEVHHARVILDEIFGAQNFVATVIWQKVYSPKPSAQYLSEDHDYVIVYAKNKSVWRPRLMPRTDSQDQAYTNPDNDPRGPWKASDLSARNPYSEGRWATETPGGRVIEGPPNGRYWTIKKSKFDDLDRDNRIWWGQDRNSIPQFKRFLSDVRDGVVPQTMWFYSDVGHNQEGKKEFVEIMRGGGSDLESGDFTPKPVRLIQRILQIATGQDDLVLDAFAGSGTTGHAVLAQNALDGGRRRFVLVEMEAAVAAPVTAERVRRAAEGYAFTGTAKTELLRERLTPRVLRRMGEVLERADALKAAHEGEGVTFAEAVDKGAYVLTKQEAVAERRAGLGGGFRFARLGPPVVDDDGSLSPEATPDALARLVFFAATGQTLAPGAAPALPLVGVDGADGDGAAGRSHAVFALGLDPSGVGGDGVLTASVLSALGALVPGDAGRWTVYGTACRVAAPDLSARGVVFRQLPYDLPLA